MQALRLADYVVKTAACGDACKELEAQGLKSWTLSDYTGPVSIKGRGHDRHWTVLMEVLSWLILKQYSTALSMLLFFLNIAFILESLFYKR